MLRGSGSLYAEATRQLRSWGSQVELEEELETVIFSLAISIDSEDPFFSDLEACSANSSNPNKDPMLSASGSEELDVVTPDIVSLL